ncbi:MAG: hypothetical protein ABDH37_02430 [Candidatus Hydrothermales bacterium]
MRLKLALLLGFTFLALILNCAPKMASKETLQRIEELKAQIEKINSEIAACEEEKKNLTAKKSEKIKLIEKLKVERDSLRTLLELIKQGY